MGLRQTSLCEFVQTKIDDCKVLVVGDVMLDQYCFGEVKRISPEAPVPITRVLKQKDTLGGAANVAHNLALLGCQTYLAGAIGKDHRGDVLTEKLQANGIKTVGLVAKEGPTTTKVRVMGGHQQMLRLDFEETSPLAGEAETALKERIREIFRQGMQSVIISDYGKGVCTPAICQWIVELCHETRIPVVVDPKGNDWKKYSGADYITPNLKEINEVYTTKIENEDDAVKKAAHAVKKKYRIQNMIVTRSEKGMSLVSARKTVHIPTLAQEVFDVSGAGDTVISVFALALAGGLPPVDAAYLSNLAASVVVAKLGTYAVSKEELLQALACADEEK